MNLFNFSFVFLHEKRVTIDNFDNLATKFTILGQNLRARALEIFPESEASFFGSSLGLSVFFRPAGEWADASEGPVHNLGKTFAKESLSDVAVRVEHGSNLERDDIGF